MFLISVVKSVEETVLQIFIAQSIVPLSHVVKPEMYVFSSRQKNTYYALVDFG